MIIFKSRLTRLLCTLERLSVADSFPTWLKWYIITWRYTKYLFKTQKIAARWSPRPRESSKKNGTMAPHVANPAQTVIFLGWIVVCCVRWGFYSLQYLKFCLLTTPSKWKWASSLKMMLFKLVNLSMISTAKISRFSWSFSSRDWVIWILYKWSAKFNVMIAFFRSPPSAPGQTFEASERWLGRGLSRIFFIYPRSSHLSILNLLARTLGHWHNFFNLDLNMNARRAATTAVPCS